MDILDQIKKNAFLNPVGSATSSVNASQTQEHNLRAQLSPNNPYLQQFDTYNKDDLEWLYQQAVQWESKQADYAQQVGVNYALTQEQREYDSPVEQIARARAAGINPDIAAGTGASSSSGGSAATAAPALPHEQSDRVDNAERQNANTQMLAGVASIAQTIVSMGANIVGAVDTVSTLPSRVRMANVQANLAEKTMPMLVNSASEQVKGLKLGNEATALDNMMSNLSMYEKLGTMFTNESPDSDIDALLSLSGMPAENIESFRNNFRAYQKNPSLQKIYRDNKTELAKSQAYAANYSISMFGKQVRNAQLLEGVQQDLQMLSGNINKSLLTYLSSHNYSDEVGQNLVATEQNKTVSLGLQRMQLERDTTAFIANIDALAMFTAASKKLVADVYKDIADTAADTKRSIPTADQQAIIDSEILKQLQCQMLGSSQLQQIFNLYNHTNLNAYNKSEYLRPNGSFVVSPTSDARKRFEQSTFQDFVTAQENGNSIASNVVQSLLSLTGKPGAVAGSIIAPFIP